MIEKSLIIRDDNVQEGFWNADISVEANGLTEDFLFVVDSATAEDIAQEILNGSTYGFLYGNYEGMSWEFNGDFTLGGNLTTFDHLDEASKNDVVRDLLNGKTYGELHSRSNNEYELYTDMDDLYQNGSELVGVLKVVNRDDSGERMKKATMKYDTQKRTIQILPYELTEEFFERNQNKVNAFVKEIASDYRTVETLSKKSLHDVKKSVAEKKNTMYTPEGATKTNNRRY